MATKNPFGNLKVKIDYDDEEQNVKQVQTNNQNVASANSQLFNVSVNDQKKKKKVRPDEKKRHDEAHAEEDTEGFSVVRKKGTSAKPKVQPLDESEPVKKEEHKRKNKGAFDNRHPKVLPGKREFERHSGTGRGKEISKQGAGGKYTWGNNPRTVAEEVYNEEDDSCN